MSLFLSVSNGASSSSMHPVQTPAKNPSFYLKASPIASIKLKRQNPCSSSTDTQKNVPINKRNFVSIKTVEAALEKYHEKLHFHGTSLKSAKSILRHGFIIEKKTDGCTDIFRHHFDIDDPAAKKHHYLMGIKSAARYAKMYEDGTILRVIVPKYIRMEKDPEGYASDEMRTSDNIPSHFVLPMSRKELKVEQIKQINCNLNIDLDDEDVSRLCKDVYKKIIKKAKKDDQLIACSLDFKSEQQRMVNFELQKISETIDLSSLKNGDTINLALEI
jgi:hypothetical protein